MQNLIVSMMATKKSSAVSARTESSFVVSVVSTNQRNRRADDGCQEKAVGDACSDIA